MAGPGGREVGRVSIRVVPDTEKFARELRAKLEQIEQQLRATIDVDVDLNSDGAVAHMRELMTRLRAMARDIDIDVDVDQDRLGGIIGSLGRMGNSAGFAGKQFMGLTRVGWIVVAVFAAAAPLIGLVAGLIAGLPSLLSAAGAGAAAIALGMDGIKNAASQLSPQLDALKRRCRRSSSPGSLRCSSNSARCSLL